MRAWQLVLLLAAVALAVASTPGCSGTTDAAAVEDYVSTAPVSAGEKDGPLYRFAVCGDSHTEGLENGVLAKITDSARSRGASFIINTGDVTNVAAQEEFQSYTEFVESSILTVYTVPGNHDLAGDSDISLFEDMVGPAYFSFSFNGDRFLLLDNSDLQDGFERKQVEWINGELTANDGRRLFIFAHVPLGGSPYHSSYTVDGKALESGWELAGEFQGHPNIEALFFGHLHGYVSYSIGDIEAYVSGGAGGPLYPLEAIGYHHYLLVTVSESSVEVEAVRV